MMDVERTATLWFRWMGMAGLVLSLAGFLLYATGIWPAGISPEETAESWRIPSQEYLEETGMEFGSMWFLQASDGYMASIGFLAILGSTALPALLALALGWLRRRDWVYAVMALAISAVLLVAILR